MEYFKFLNVIQERITELLQPKVSIKEHHALKNNGIIRAGLMFSEHGVNVSPTIYLEEFYEQHLCGRSMESIVQEIMVIYDRVKVKESISDQSILDFSKLKGKIIFKMVQYSANVELLETMPHVRYLDLAMVFSVLLSDQDGGRITMAIHNEHMEKWKVGLEDLVLLAKNNTERLFPVKIIKISDFMYVITNKACCYGAAVMAYDGIWTQMHQMIGEDFHVIPSSVHELILVPESFGMEEDEMRKMVNEINSTEVEPEEVLSSQVYFYSMFEGKLTMSRFD